MILALILSMTMLMGMCLTAMAAPNNQFLLTGGVWHWWDSSSVDHTLGVGDIIPAGTAYYEDSPTDRAYLDGVQLAADASLPYDAMVEAISYTEIYLVTPPAPAPAKPAEPAKKSEPVPVHTHSYSWKTLSAPTTEKDGVEGLACECGDVIETQPISAEGYTLRLNEQVIRLAGSGAPVVVDLGRYNVLPKWFVKSLVERDDLNITLKISYDHKNYVLEVPKTATIEDESIEWYGPLKLMSMFPQK